MRITEKILLDAVKEGIISPEQADRLLTYAKDHPASGPVFDFTHVLYYMGGLIAIGAMTLFMNLGWQSFGGWGILVISSVYAVIGLRLSDMFASKGYKIPAGICATFVVALTPLAIYGLQQGLGVWPDDTAYRDYHRYVKWHWLYMEAGTLIAGAIIAWRYRYPFLVMPIAVTAWYMTMDITAIISGGDLDWELRQLVSLYTGLVMIGLAFWVDIRTRNKADYAFWIYLFGVIAFWGGLSLQDSDSELSRFLYLCVNLVMTGIGVLLVRRVFVVFGALGSAGYLGHLASHVFEDSWLFPVSLTAIGLLVIYLGVLWKKNEKAITEKVRKFLPVQLQELVRSRS